jgi:two-component system LytT family response regulator
MQVRGSIMSAYQYFRQVQAGTSVQPEAGSRLVVQTGTGEAVLSWDDIFYVEASRNYVEVHTADKSYLIRDTLANIESRLARGSFVRSHRSYMVNLDRVSEIKSVDGGREIFLDNGAKVPLSRSYREAFRASISAG